MQRPRPGVARFLLAVVLAGCGSSTGTPTPGRTASASTSPTPSAGAPASSQPQPDGEGSPAQASAIDAGVWSLPADPLDVDVTLETSAQVTTSIDKAGGTLTAVGGDGSRYTLTIPAQEVWGPTAISMTPITSISARGKTAGSGVVFGVQLSPSGLQLIPDASLQIDPTTSLDKEAIVYFGYEGDGDDVGIEVPDARASGHALAISGFSGAGIVRRTTPAGGADDESGVYEVLADQVASRVAANRLSHVVARQFARDREATLAGQEVDPRSSIAATAAWQMSYLQEVVEPLIAVAGHPAATCEQASEAAAALSGAARQRALLGVGDDEAAMEQVVEAFDAAAARLEPLLEAACRRDAARSCRETGDLIDVVRRSFAEERTRIGLGSLSDAEFQALTEAYRAILRWCGVYELTWTSTGKISTALYTVSTVIDGHMTLRYAEDEAGDISKIRLEGVTTSELVPFLTSINCTSYQDRMVCPPGATPQAPTAGVVTELELRVVYTTQVAGQAVGRTQGENRVTLEFNPSAMKLMALFRTPGKSTIVPLEIYKASFMVAHAPDVVGKIIRIGDWDHVGHPLMFKKTYSASRSKQEATFSDSTEFRLTHTPDPQP